MTPRLPPAADFSPRAKKRDGSSGREAASAKPRCLPHPKTRPACAPPAADRREAANRPSSNRKRGVSPGRMSRPCSRAQPGGRKRECTSERSQDGEANARRIGPGLPRATPNARRIGLGSPRATPHNRPATPPAATARQLLPRPASPPPEVLPRRRTLPSGLAPDAAAFSAPPAGKPAR